MRRWLVVGASVQGAQHRRTDRPNQDALGWQDDGAPGVAIGAVADGHGSPRCFRSGTGAQLAVDAVVATLSDVSETAHDFGTEPWAKAVAAAVVAHWRRGVEQDVAAHPLEADELSGLGEDAEAVATRFTSWPSYAYGTTAIGVRATETHLVFLQIGDGDALLVDGSTGFVTRPVAADARLIGNETTSLSSPDAANDVRMAIVPVTPESPALILLSTDGYANSFADDTGFAQAAHDLWTLVCEDGPAAVQAALPDWLAETSTEGSGDDISVVLLVRPPEPML